MNLFKIWTVVNDGISLVNKKYDDIKEPTRFFVFLGSVLLILVLLPNFWNIITVAILGLIRAFYLLQQ